jgi:hypothetical protein
MLSVFQVEEIKAEGERKMSVQKKTVEVKVILVHAVQIFGILS